MPPTLPVLPTDLADWRWTSVPGGDMALTHPDGAYTTKGYQQPKRAVADAQRWLAQQASTAAPTAAPPAPRVIGEAAEVPTWQIADNPFQPRLAYDAERIAAIAASIKEHGLLQVPLARRTSAGAVELAFGHSRLRAYQLLAQEDPDQWGLMPLVIRPLDDETMALHAWIENKDRKDLTAFEEAKAIERYTSAFGWSQAKAAEKLQLDRSTVANKLRLLRLPVRALEQLQAGQLSERQAAALLPLMDLTSAARAQDLGYSVYVDNVRVASVDDLLTRAGEFDSARLRNIVERMLDHLTLKLEGKVWASEDFTGVAGVQAPICKECPLRLKGTNRCPNQECAAKKLLAHRARKADAAAAAVELPSTGYREYSECDTLDSVNLDALAAIAREKGCGRLAVAYDENRREFPHPVAGHERCGIVCGHGPRGRCGCKQTLINRADPATGREARERHEKARIKNELVPPATSALTRALEAPTAGLWRILLRKIDWNAESKLPAGASAQAVLAALAQSLVNEKTEYSTDSKYARQGLEELFSRAGLPSPFQTTAEQHATTVRQFLAQARELLGIPMAHYAMGEARVAHAAVIGEDLRVAEELQREIDQVAAEVAVGERAAQLGGRLEAQPRGYRLTPPEGPAETYNTLAEVVVRVDALLMEAPADVRAQTPAPGHVDDAALRRRAAELSDLVARREILEHQIAGAAGGVTVDELTFAQFTKWVDAFEGHLDAGHTTSGDTQTLEWLAGLLEEFTDRQDQVDDATYEAMDRRLDALAERVGGQGVPQ